MTRMSYDASDEMIAAALKIDWAKDVHEEDIAGEIWHAMSALAPPDVWQPKKTAPKDGVSFIGLHWDHAWERRGDIVRCWWDQDIQAFISSVREMRLAPGLTFKDGGSVQKHSPVIEHISYWIPFPSLPNSIDDAKTSELPSFVTAIGG